MFDPACATGATFALRIDGEWFRLAASGTSLDISRGRPGQPDVTLETDAATLRRLAFGREPTAEAERDGRLTVRGDRRAAERFARMFAVPVAPPRPSGRPAPAGSLPKGFPDRPG